MPPIERRLTNINMQSYPPHLKRSGRARTSIRHGPRICRRGDMPGKARATSEELASSCPGHRTSFHTLYKLRLTFVESNAENHPWNTAQILGVAEPAPGGNSLSMTMRLLNLDLRG